MPCDAHAHPFDLFRLDPGAETERRALGVVCAASAWNEAEFLFNENLATAAADGTSVAEASPRVVLCFGVHPQLPATAAASGDSTGDPAVLVAASLETLERLAAEGRIAAVGEAGFDLFDARFKATEAEQERLFQAQLGIAKRYNLPLVLHLRRATHKAFAYSRDLARLNAVVFHSYSGTAREVGDLLKRGVNAFFSFGTVIALNHRKAMEACSSVPADRILFETDAPYQPLRGAERSSWSDLATVTATASSLRRAAGGDLGDPREAGAAADANFYAAFGLRASRHSL